MTSRDILSEIFHTSKVSDRYLGDILDMPAMTQCKREGNITKYL